jgi:hypothetical protein
MQSLAYFVTLSSFLTLLRLPKVFSVNVNWIEDMHVHADDPWGKGPSQGAQYIYLQQIFENIQTTNKFYVEFGFNCRESINCGSGPNIAILFADGWHGLLLDGENENLSFNLHAHYLFHNNIASIFEKYDVPKEFDYLSVDMDSHDIFVLQGILEGGFRPRVVSHEYNSNYPLGSEISVLDPSFLQGEELKVYKFSFRGCVWGSSASAFNLLLVKYGYVAVGRVSNLDIFYIRKDILDQFVGLKVPPLPWYFAGFHPHHGEEVSHHSEVPDMSYLNYLIDYGEYFRSNFSISVGREKVKESLSHIKGIHCLKNIRPFL